MKLILLTILFTTFLNAEYLRTIRLGSFTSQERAQLELSKVHEFVKKHKNIIDFQKIWDFEFTYRKSGKYFIVIAEPLRDRAVLQEVIDTLRILFPDAYATKLDKAPKFVKAIQIKVVPKPKPKEEVVLEEMTPEPLYETEVISKEDAVIDITTQEVEEVTEEVTEEVVEDSGIEEKVIEPLEYSFDEKEQTIHVDEELQIKSEVTDIYQTLFFGLLLLFFVVSLLLWRYKRKSIYCKDREIQTNEIFTKKDREIRHKDSFLTHAKTSVADIHNFTNLLLEFHLTVIQKDYVQRIRSSSEHLLNTVNNTLDITKLKNETLKIENTEFDLNEMLRKVSKIISLEAKNNETEFELNVENDVPAFIFGDPTRIRQVLINLLGNSVKYTNNGKISLTIKTLYNYTNAITLGFIIKDTGVGMSSEQVQDILSSSTEIIEGGTVGLGLSVTKQLIQMMNGEIKIYSTEDLGTTFTFTLKFKVTR